MGAEGFQPLAFHSRIDDSDKKRFRENVDCLKPGTWLTPSTVSARKIELLDPHGDPVGHLMSQSVESIAPRLELGWAVRILAHQRYLLRDEDGDPDPDRVSFTLLVFTYPPEQEDHMAPQLAHAAELMQTTGLSYKLTKKKGGGLLTVELTPEDRPADLTASTTGCAGSLLLMVFSLVAAALVGFHAPS